MGKCPKCEQSITSVNLEGPTIGNKVFGPMIRGYMATCPRCQTVIGITVDPNAVAQQVAEALGVKSGARRA